MNEPYVIWKAVAAIGSIVAVGNALIIKPLRDRITTLESKIDDRYTKKETVEQIDSRLRPLEQSVNNLNDTLKEFKQSVDHLSEHVTDLKLWQQREIGRRKEGPD